MSKSRQLGTGYADRQLGRAPECPIELDALSYSLGFRQGRASRAESERAAAALSSVID